jgi:hypothetical protein
MKRSLPGSAATGAVSLPGNVGNVGDCERRPARLMTGPEAATGFSVEIFVEKEGRASESAAVQRAEVR